MRTLNGCVVLTAPLSVAVKCFVSRWNVDRPWSDGEIGFVGALEWLSGESGLGEETIRNVSRGRYRTTEMSVADALAQALGHPEWFYDGTLTIQPNPSAPRALREECCGGSSFDPAPPTSVAA